MQLAIQTGNMIVLFFFQAEDGIRDWSVTGVQTCALPICEVRDLDGEVDVMAGLRARRRPDDRDGRGPDCWAVAREDADGRAHVRGQRRSVALDELKANHMGPRWQRVCDRL